MWLNPLLINSLVLPLRQVVCNPFPLILLYLSKNLQLIIRYFFTA